MDWLKRKRIQPDMSAGMNFRVVMGNRRNRNNRIGQSAGKSSGKAPTLRRHRGTTTDFLEKSPVKQPWKSVRPAKVAKGKLLVRDKNYPPREVIESVAGLLANHLGELQ